MAAIRVHCNRHEVQLQEAMCEGVGFPYSTTNAFGVD